MTMIIQQQPTQGAASGSTKVPKARACFSSRCYSLAEQAWGKGMQFLQELLSRSTADGSRTNALNHLQWMLAAILASLLGAVYAEVRDGVLIFLGLVFLVLLLCYLVTHFYFMVKNPDALRSEKFTIEKMAIERGLLGDDRAMFPSIQGRVDRVDVLENEEGESP